MTSSDAPVPLPPAAVSCLVTDASGATRRIEGKAGEPLLDALRRAAAEVAPLCFGRIACGGCLVRIDAAWRERVTPCGRRELSLLRYLEEPHEDDRLACQIELTAEVEGLELRTLPARAPRPAPAEG